MGKLSGEVESLAVRREDAGAIRVDGVRALLAPSANVTTARDRRPIPLHTCACLSLLQCSTMFYRYVFFFVATAPFFFPAVDFVFFALFFSSRSAREKISISSSVTHRLIDSFLSTIESVGESVNTITKITLE